MKTFQFISVICAILMLLSKYIQGSGIYGDIGNLTPTGASAKTASADHLYYDGVRASYQLAREDLLRMTKFKANIISVAKEFKIDPAVIAGIISRESRAGNALNAKGWGDHGNAYGLMQVDKRYHTPRGGPYSAENIAQGTQILVNGIRKVQKKFPHWALARQMQGGVAAYNFGVRNVRSWNSLDIGTTNNDYSNDVIARAKYYRSQGY